MPTAWLVLALVLSGNATAGQTPAHQQGAGTECLTQRLELGKCSFFALRKIVMSALFSLVGSKYIQKGWASLELHLICDDLQGLAAVNDRQVGPGLLTLL